MQTNPDNLVSWLPVRTPLLFPAHIPPASTQAYADVLAAQGDLLSNVNVLNLWLTNRCRILGSWKDKLHKVWRRGRDCHAGRDSKKVLQCIIYINYHNKPYNK